MNCFEKLFGKKEEPAAGAAAPSSAPAPSKPSSKLVEGTVEWYRAAFSECQVDKGYEKAVEHDVALVLHGKDQYLVSQNDTGVLWWIIGGMHFKEASCDFAAILHNGQRGIIGADAMRHNRKSTIVPKGVGPFPSWRAATIDAVKGSRWEKIRKGSHDIGEVLYAAERFNGTGYLSGAGKDETSPYLWARSSINDDFGKYTHDHEFDPRAPTNKTTGFALIAKELLKMGEIQLAV